ncbi:MAG: type II toxin-antitoxin system RelE/ParE family toxin [Candidatus Eremiobacteraeota bacterium]|nr:type II toxin-antitoxin system RelE/ParE family toxin [Candidatus Eremiobacteraeota bacterium]MCW5870067.1 type II toxin-antitoxin system RelE/ParE family toxin [Candidatus Eremiobacteraeota bacterium]
MSDYQLTDLAQRDLEEIVDYIAGKLNNPDGAQVVLDYLYQAMEDIGERPSRGHARPDLTDRPVRFYRKSRAQKYYLIFDPSTRPVIILRIASVRRDFLGLLEEKAQS